MTTTGSLSVLTPKQLATLKRTVAKKLNDVEFDLFMEACRSYQLDPFRRQIIPVIDNENDRDKRRMTFIVTRDGLRVVASRQGDYRPASEPAEFLMKPDSWTQPREAPPNPLKIEACTVRLWKKDMGSGDWFPVIGQVYWDEYAPRGEGWAKSQWAHMPRVMIQKCAEAAALRAGWPDAFAGLYVAEEMASASARDMTASEAVAQAEMERRGRMVGQGIIFNFKDGPAELVSAGKVFDRVCRALGDMTDEEVAAFRAQNEIALNQYWATAPSEALELKRIIEARIDDLKQQTKREKHGDD